MTELLTGGHADDVPQLGRPDWQQRAACRGASRAVRAALFADDDLATQMAAIECLCWHCPVIAECADWGLRHERFGVWGGQTQASLDSVRARINVYVDFLEPVDHVPSNAQGCGTRAGYMRHRRNGTPVCADCRMANADWVAAQRKDKPRDRKAEVARRRERQLREIQGGD